MTCTRCTAVPRLAPLTDIPTPPAGYKLDCGTTADVGFVPFRSADGISLSLYSNQTAKLECAVGRVRMCYGPFTWPAADWSEREAEMIMAKIGAESLTV